MLIELRNGIIIEPCSFTAIVGPEQVVIDMINNNVDLQRYLFLFLSGNYSRVLNNITRTITKVELRRAFTAYQLYTVLQEAAHSIIFVEHDSSLYDDAKELITPIAGILSELSHDTTVIIYAKTADRSFGALTQKARHLVCYITDDDPLPYSDSYSSKKQKSQNSQTTLNSQFSL